MNNIKFPVLYCPFRPVINQHCDAAYQHSLNWVRSFNLVINESVYQSLLAGKYNVLVARTYPYASFEDLEMLNDLMLWILFLDDQFEDVGISKQLEILEPLQARLLEIMKKEAELTDIDMPIVRAWGDIMEKLYHHPCATSEWVLCFTKSMEDYFQGVRWEALNNSQEITPDVTTFKEMRTFTSCSYPFMNLILITDRIALPPEAINHPIVKRLELATDNVISWANDIFSVRKEIKAGNNCNLVTVLREEYQISLQEAFDRAAELHNAEVRLFIDLSAQLPSFGTEIDANLERYLLGLRCWIRGNLDWSIETERY